MAEPTFQIFKVNWDAAISTPRKRMGVEVLIWDKKGRVIAVQSKTIHVVYDLTTAKTMAVEFCEIRGRVIYCWKGV